MQGRSFDIGDGIFWFFKCFGKKPGAALWIALWQALVGTAIAGLILYLMLPALAEFADTIVQIESGGMDDEEGAFILIGALFAMFSAGAWGMILGVVAMLMFQGAWLRFLTRGEVAAIIPFRLGGDEFRLLGVNLLYLVVGIAMYFAVIMIFVVLGVSGGSILAAGDEASVGGAMGFGLVMFFGFLALMASIIFVATKLSSAPALTVHDRKFRFFESWEATNGVFWPLLLAYVVVGLLVMVLSLVVGTIIELIFLGAMWPMLQELIILSESNSDPSFDEVMAIFTSQLSNTGVMVTFGIGVVLSYLLQIVYEGMWHGVGAYNAVRCRDGSTVDEGDAPVIGEDSPLGASPSEG